MREEFTIHQLETNYNLQVPAILKAPPVQAVYSFFLQ